jgi:hypothetical protein
VFVCEVKMIHAVYKSADEIIKKKERGRKTLV